VSWRLPPDMRWWNHDEPAGPRVLNSLFVDVIRNAAELLRL
jgi:hypothetical protein